MEYIAFKHTHVLFVVLSILLFFTRSVSRFRRGTLASHKGVFIASHSADTLLLLSAVGMLFIGGLNPLSHTWLLEKIFFVLIYIIAGVVCAKVSSKKVQVAAFSTAITSLLIVGFLAGSKQSIIL